MTNMQPGAPALDLETARVVLERLGITAETLLATPRQRDVPTFADYIDRVSEAVTSGTQRAYRSYWKRIRDAWGERRMDEPTPLEIKQLAEQVRHNAVVRSNSRGGRTAAEHTISALRCLYKHAVLDGYIAERDDPSARVAKPRRLPSTRRALSDAQLAQVVDIASTTGNDPELDALLLRLHTETACRRAGALALRLCDLDEADCLIRLHEKGESVRWQPVSPTLMRGLIRHHQERVLNADAEGQLLRYRNGQPITSRRYDYLWSRIGKRLPWVAAQGVSTHWIRHTTLTWVERQFGYAVARAFAGHNGRSDAGSTSTYVRADVDECATALAALAGEEPPLARVAASARQNPTSAGLRLEGLRP